MLSRVPCMNGIGVQPEIVSYAEMLLAACTPVLLMLYENLLQIRCFQISFCSSLVMQLSLAGASPEFWDLLLGLLRKDPSDRLTWEEISRHPFWREAFELEALPGQQRWESFVRAGQKTKHPAGSAIQVLDAV